MVIVDRIDRCLRRDAWTPLILNEPVGMFRVEPGAGVRRAEDLCWPGPVGRLAGGGAVGSTYSA